MKDTPAIPPLSPIADRAARDVLFALVSGWNLRNGDSQLRLVTKAELDALEARVARLEAA